MRNANCSRTSREAMAINSVAEGCRGSDFVEHYCDIVFLSNGCSVLLLHMRCSVTDTRLHSLAHCLSDCFRDDTVAFMLG